MDIGDEWFAMTARISKVKYVCISAKVATVIPLALTFCSSLISLKWTKLCHFEGYKCLGTSYAIFDIIPFSNIQFQSELGEMYCSQIIFWRFWQNDLKMRIASRKPKLHLCHFNCWSCTILVLHVIIKERLRRAFKISQTQFIGTASDRFNLKRIFDTERPPWLIMKK